MIIKIEDLTKEYKEVVAVNHLNLEIKDTGVFALLGLNGAGKTTLIKMLSCLTIPTSGNAWVMGHSILKEEQQIKEIINISPQETAIAPNLTVEENLMFIAEIYGLEKEKAKMEVDSIITQFKLEEKRKTSAKKLSGGMQRRLGVAMAVITKPKILFLDEPTLGLDVMARRELWKLIDELKKTTTIILTTHYLEEVEHLADRVAIMKKGSIIMCDTVKNIIANSKEKTFEDAFVALNGEA